MSDAGFQMFAKAYPVAEELVYAACLALFLRPFLAERKRGYGTALIFCASLLVWQLCGSAALQGAFGLILTMLLIALSGTLGVDRRLMLLLALLYWNAKNAGGLLVVSLDFIVTQFWLAPAKVPETIFLRSAIMLTLFLLAHAALLGFMLFVLRHRLRKRTLALHGRELCCLGLLPAAGILFGQMISRLLFEMEDGELLQLYERHPAFLGAVPVLALLFYAGAWLMIALQQGLAAMREEQAALYAEYRQMREIRGRIHEAEQSYAQIRRLKHDMRGHLNNIMGLANCGEYDALKDYIARMDESLNGAERTARTGNPVTDVIVGDTRRRCLELGIRFRTDFCYPTAGGYDAFDVGIILQNLLLNAVEASGKAGEDERFISLTGRRKGRFFLIEVKNLFVGEVTFGPDGLPVTTKTENAPMHGLGLGSVRRVAAKYMGELELKIDRQVFSAAVLLQERSN